MNEHIYNHLKTIKVLIPDREQIEELNQLGVDGESELIKAFVEELHKRIKKFYPDLYTENKNENR